MFPLSLHFCLIIPSFPIFCPSSSYFVVTSFLFLLPFPSLLPPLLFLVFVPLYVLAIIGLSLFTPPLVHSLSLSPFLLLSHLRLDLSSSLMYVDCFFVYSILFSFSSLLLHVSFMCFYVLPSIIFCLSLSPFLLLVL